MTSTNIPVIAIDGPSASGKGTVARLVAQRLNFHFLDSGSLYRLTALAALRTRVSLDDEMGLARLARQLDVRFEGDEVVLSGERVTDAIRSEEVGGCASRVASYPQVRAALLECQRAFRQAPGLVADGRDMGSVVFPDAQLKIFLTASAEERANRRYKQLMGKGMYANMRGILQDIQQRDARDSGRSIAPLQQCADAELLDTTSLTVAVAVAEVVERYRKAASARSASALNPQG